MDMNDKTVVHSNTEDRLSLDGPEATRIWKCATGSQQWSQAVLWGRKFKSNVFIIIIFIY